MNTIAGGSSELPSSAHAVVSSDDLLIEILLRLPFLPLHLFKSVSKRWLTLITDPNFTLRRTQNPTLDPPSALILQRKTYWEYDFVPFDVRIPASRFSLPATFTLDFDSGKVKILQSCNGLLLCNITGIYNKFCVYNPFTNRFKMIPQCPYPKLNRLLGGLRMAFDPSKSPHYKIVYAGDTDYYGLSTIQMQIYSSETCGWRVCDHRFRPEGFVGFNHAIYDWNDARFIRGFNHGTNWNDALFRGFNHGIYWNDAIHWLDWVQGGLHYKLDVENPNLRSIQTPKTSDGTMHCYQKLFESRGCLLLLCAEDEYSLQLSIFEMRKWCIGWSMKYIVNLDDIMMRFPKTWREPRKWFCLSVGCIMIEKNEEDSFIVMEIYGKIVQYKFVSKSIYKLYELKSIHSKASFEFIASSADV